MSWYALHYCILMWNWNQEHFALWCRDVTFALQYRMLYLARCCCAVSCRPCCDVKFKPRKNAIRNMCRDVKRNLVSRCEIQTNEPVQGDIVVCNSLLRSWCEFHKSRKYNVMSWYETQSWGRLIFCRGDPYFARGSRSVSCIIWCCGANFKSRNNSEVVSWCDS